VEADVTPFVGAESRVDSETLGVGENPFGPLTLCGAHDGSGSSSGRAWARRRISSTITDAIVMAFRHDLARASRPAHAHKAG
jgi:hypothetical protein